MAPEVDHKSADSVTSSTVEPTSRTSFLQPESASAYLDNIFYQDRMGRLNTPLIAIVVALVVIAAAFSVLRARFKPRDGLFAKPWPLEAKRQLLTERERALYERLVEALPNYLVLAQVQLLQVLNFKRGRRSQAILNRFNQLSLDFLILNPDTSIVAAVELDDATHTRVASRQADARKDHALKSAGIPLIRWNAKSLPDTAAILAALPAKTSAPQANA